MKIFIMCENKIFKIDRELIYLERSGVCKNFFNNKILIINRFVSKL